MWSDPVMKPRFFATPAAFRTWLSKHHATATELLVGFHKNHTGKPSMTWPESVAEALCFGWIDGIRRRLDDSRYTIRFTPRRENSKWSAVNIRLIASLETEGRMTASGRAAFNARPHKTGPKSAGYSYEKREAKLDGVLVNSFKKQKTAWVYFESQPPGYRKKLSWWVMSAKQEQTRTSRLAKLVAACAAGRRLT
jgi:uncharacterized protein YdeI (YjbR/CyaY-like superfamily)